ncbi:hypothetical protein OIO90_005936 [Microbotryomycetes sp. JL221]|nr:hypothetical protein OIO90_005936 [Microbotryomycetes sp. JL221]
MSAIHHGIAQRSDDFKTASSIWHARTKNSKTLYGRPTRAIKMKTCLAGQGALNTDDSLSCRASQRERLVMIRLALQDKLGVDAGNAHYDLADNRYSQVETDTQGVQSVATNGNQDSDDQIVNEDEGMYL